MFTDIVQMKAALLPSRSLIHPASVVLSEAPISRSDVLRLENNADIRRGLSNRRSEPTRWLLSRDTPDPARSSARKDAGRR
jgi:hypothetical protein